MKNMNCVNTMPEIMPEITDEAIIEALFAQRPYEEKVINSAFLEIPAEYQRKLNIPNVEKMSAEFTELIANPPKVSYRDGHYFVFDGQHTIVTRRAMNGGQDLPIICKVSGAANSMMRRWESVFREYPDILSDAENRASVGRTIQKLRDYLKNLEDKMEELL